MESVLTAFVILFLVLFAALTLSQAIVASQESLSVAWQEMEARVDTQARTSLSTLDAYTSEAGALLNVSLRNDGRIKLADFDVWDVIVQYSSAAGYHLGWLPYDIAPPTANRWQISGISFREGVEQFEPGILNPGEDLLVQVRVTPPVAPGAGIQVVLVPGTGVSLPVIFLGNHPPELVINSGLTLTSGGSAPITTNLLAVTDADDRPSGLVYEVTTAPEQGTLSLGDTFTQDEIDTGALIYEHSGAGDDVFRFSVTDGKDVIGIYDFVITADVAPALVTNSGLTLTSGGSWIIDAGLLAASDPDTLAADLVYTITAAPEQGTLTLGATFTQADLDAGHLIYQHTGTGSDSFSFTVSDGVTTTGPYTFNVMVY